MEVETLKVRWGLKALTPSEFPPPHHPGHTDFAPLPSRGGLG